MTHEDHPSRSVTTRRFAVSGLLAIMFLGALLAALALQRDEDVGVAAPNRTQSSAEASSHNHNAEHAYGGNRTS
jgi:hypothetical protein